MAESKKAATKAPRRKAAKAAGDAAVKTARAPKAQAPRASRAAKAVAAPELTFEMPTSKPASEAVTSSAAEAVVAPVTILAPMVETAVETVVETVRAAAQAAPRPAAVAAPAARMMEAGVDHAREAYATAQSTSEQIRQAMAESANATTRGALEVNGKVIEALRAQSDAAFDLWHQALAAGSFAEAVRVQATGARQVYETAAAHWKDVAETTTRWLGSAVRPMQSALDHNRRA